MDSILRHWSFRLQFRNCRATLQLVGAVAPHNSVVQNAPGQAAWFGAALALLNIMVGVIAQFIAAWTL
jgi:hypothetical protein